MKRKLEIIAAVCPMALIGSLARATTTYSIDPAAISAQPGDVGDSFDVIFTNNGPGDLSISAFSFEVTVTDPDITLTGASYSTSAYPYIFAGDSLFQDASLPLNFVNVDGYSPQILDAADTTNDLLGFTIPAGTSADLGEVLFDVASSAQPGQFAINFTGEVSDVANANNLATPDGDGVPVDSFSSGIITVTVPEPSAFLLPSLAITALVAGPLGRRRFRRPV